MCMCFVQYIRTYVCMYVHVVSGFCTLYYVHVSEWSSTHRLLALYCVCVCVCVKLGVHMPSIRTYAHTLAYKGLCVHA